MSKKKWFAIAALFALTVALALVIAVPALLPPTPGVTYANYSRLAMGMTPDQVKALLGPPNSPDGPDEDSLQYIWETAAGDIVGVGFDADRRVREIGWNGWSDDRTGLEKLRDRLPWIGQKPPTFLREYK